MDCYGVVDVLVPVFEPFVPDEPVPSPSTPFDEVDDPSSGEEVPESNCPAWLVDSVELDPVELDPVELGPVELGPVVELLLEWLVIGDEPAWGVVAGVGM